MALVALDPAARLVLLPDIGDAGATMPCAIAMLLVPDPDEGTTATSSQYVVSEVPALWTKWIRSFPVDVAVKEAFTCCQPVADEIGAYTELLPCVSCT